MYLVHLGDIDKHLLIMLSQQSKKVYSWTLV